MAAALGVILFAYICLVFLVTHRICMMQCNPMSRPGIYQGDMGDMRFSGSHVQGDGSHHHRREQPNIRHIRFEPSYLDFYEQSVGMPSIRTVSVINPHTEQNLQLQSISGSTSHFHASFFQSKVVYPLGNTTFEIVFLARLVGNVENTLFIHTSKGVYPYQVFGVGLPNPYRLRPFLGARVPLNYSFSTIINMHNPYDSPLQVIEMYSSGGDLHLELPSGLEEAPQKHWEIPPYETKALMRVSFVGRVASNHTAFIRIKASQPAPIQELLILPVEVEVTSAPGLFSSTDMLDFGTLRTMDEPKSIGLYLLNAGHKQVHISAISVEPTNSALSINFTPILLKPGSKYIKVATATYSAFHVKRSRQTTGKVIIKTNSKISPRLEIPYQVNILQGTIAYSVSKTRFFVGKPPFDPVSRELSITNTFSFTMVIYDAAFPAEMENIFSIVNFTKPAMIPPQSTVTPFYVQFLANGSDMAFSTILRVYTNASIFTVPIHCYDGKLKYGVDGLEEDVVDYGTVGTGENRTKLLKIINNNPIEVTIYRIECNIQFARLKLLAIKSSNDSKLFKGNQSLSNTMDQPVNGEAEDGKVHIKPGFVAYFSVEAAVPKREGQYIGEIEMETDYETLHIPLHLKSMDGKIVSAPASVIFQPGFPGQIVNYTLTLLSSFSNTLKLESVKPHLFSDQFSFEPVTSEVQLLPNERVEVGQLYYDPSKSCKNLCHTGIHSSEQWLSSFSLPSNVGEIDSQLIEKNQKLFSSLERSGKTRLNLSFIIDTDVVKGFQIPAQASLSWPSFSSDKPVKFPLTHLGNVSVKFFTLENPADVPVLAQIVPFSLYPQGVWDILTDRFDTETYGFDPDETTFSVPSHEDYLSTLGSEIAHASGTLLTILKPRAVVRIPVLFKPKDERLKTSVVLIRNNLTVLDGIVVQGQGARGEFTLNGKRPGSQSTLLFEIKPSQLTDCHKAAPRTRSLQPLSVMKTVTATNPGQLSMFISSLSINGYECEGYGFKIMNCKSFILKPNTSRKIEITFTPDFSMSRVTRKLEVKTTVGPVLEFTLVATIPTHLLPLCSSALGRNSWEPVVQIVAVVLMGVVFLAVMIAAYAEARRLVFLSHPEMQLLQMKQEERGPIFDLNAIAGVKKNKIPAREEQSVSQKRTRRDQQRESRETTPVSSERPSSCDSVTTSLANTLPTNNNIKTVTASTSRQENNGMRNRNTRTEVAAVKIQPNATENADTRAIKASSLPLEIKTCSVGKDNKPKGTVDNRGKGLAETVASITRKVVEPKKSEQRVCEENRKTEPKSKSIPEGFNDEIISVVIPNKCESAPKRDSKESKGKQKRKTKPVSKKEGKEKRVKAKENTAAKGKEDEGVLSDDSCSDGSSDKSVPEVKIQQPSNDINRTRNGNLPPDTQLKEQQQNNSKQPNHTGESFQDTSRDRAKGRKNQVTPENANSKGKKETQLATGTARPKVLEVQGKSQCNAHSSKIQSNTCSPVSPTSPHAIAAAVVSALNKNMQASSKENNYDEQEPNKRKAYTKTSTLSSSLSDSPPPTSPTLLSGSSRSSSYSSIVSSDSSNGMEQVKSSVLKGNKSRVKSTKSASLEAGVGPPWSSTGSRKSSKSGEDLGLSGLRRNPWSTSVDSHLTPRGPVGERPDRMAPSSHFMPQHRPSLLDSQSYNRRGLKKQASVGEEKARPLDLGDFGLSDNSATRNRGLPAEHRPYWNSSEQCYHNRDSLFSSSSRSSEDQFPGKSSRLSNNWVNFLDVSNTNSGVVSSNKTMAEIWDVGNSPQDSDGWSVYRPPTSSPGQPLSSEADAVDALFSHMPNWSGEGAVVGPESPFSTQEVTWTPPPDVSSIWSGGYLGSASTAESLPTSTAVSFASYSVQLQSNQDSTPTFDPLGSLGGGIWDPSSKASTWSSTSE